jgi:hypothetical protein
VLQLLPIDFVLKNYDLLLALAGCGLVSLPAQT